MAEEDAKGRFDASSFNTVLTSTISQSGNNATAPTATMSADPMPATVPVNPPKTKPGLASFFNVEVANRYGILADHHDPECHSSDPNNMDVQHSDDYEVEDSPSTQAPKKGEKPPPICFVSRVEKHFKEFRSSLESISSDYYQHFAVDKTMVYFRQLSDYKKFVKTFSGKLPFYTFTPRVERTFAFLIKGVHD